VNRRQPPLRGLRRLLWCCLLSVGDPCLLSGSHQAARRASLPGIRYRMQVPFQPAGSLPLRRWPRWREPPVPASCWRAQLDPVSCPPSLNRLPGPSVPENRIWGTQRDHESRSSAASSRIWSGMQGRDNRTKPFATPVSVNSLLFREHYTTRSQVRMEVGVGERTGLSTWWRGVCYGSGLR